MTSQRGVDNALLRLQGRWVMVGGARDGRPFPDSLVQRSERVTEGDETLVRIDGQLLQCATFVMHPELEPIGIDLTITAGPGKGQTQLGICDLEGDRLRLCVALTGAPRPRGFGSTPGDGCTFSEWRRP